MLLWAPVFLKILGILLELSESTQKKVKNPSNLHFVFTGEGFDWNGAGLPFKSGRVRILYALEEWTQGKN